MKTFWDEQFANETYIYGTAPNEFFKDQIKDLKPGTILFPCEGEGRNAVYAAKQGWNTYATDQSSEGKKKATQLAKTNGVTINYQVSDIMDYQSGHGVLFDVIVLVFGHFPPGIRTRVHQQLLKMLKPGGTFILEGFNKNQINNGSGGPKNIDMLYSKEELLSDFVELKIAYIDETQVQLNEGDWHQGIADVIRLNGKKLVHK